MPNDEHDAADTIAGSGSNHQESSNTIQLSANMKTRLGKLAVWRIDPALLKFPKDGQSFEGGYAIVSRALLASSSDESGEQVVEPSGRDLNLDNRITTLQGDREGRQAEGSSEEAKRKNSEVIEGEEQESDDETSGWWEAVAVKKMKIKTQDDIVRTLGLTLREAEFLVKLSHNNVIELEGFVEDVAKGMIWLVFPWEENGTLKDFVASHEWEIPERIALIYDVASGVKYLHSRKPPICHGDLKSINILVSSQCRAIITDFGSAHHPVTKSPKKGRERTAEETRLAPSLEATLCPSTNTITLTCSHYTLRWAAPELLEEDDASLASDIWAFGCVAYEVITDSIPFQHDKDAVVIKRIVQGDLPSISDDTRMLLIQALCSLVGRCWSVNPSERPSADECGNELRWMPMIVPNPLRTADTANLTGDSATLLMQLGHMYRHQSDYSNASTYYAKALSVYSDLADMGGKASALLDLAQIQRFQQEYNKAVTFYSEALNLYINIADNQGRAIALFGLASVHKARNEYSQAVRFFSECLQIYTDINNKDGRASSLWGLADVHRLRNEDSQAVAFYSECLQIRTDIGDARGRADALFGLADVHRARNEYSQAVAFYSECVKIRADVGDRRGRASALWGIADVHRLRGEYSQAVAFYSESLQIRTDIGDRYGRAQSLWGLADVYLLRKEYSQAVALYSESLQIWTDVGDRQGRAFTLRGLAEVHRLQMEYRQGMTLLSEALEISIEIGDRYSQAFTLDCMANTHCDQHDHRNAIHYYEQAAGIYKEIGHTNEAISLERAAKLRRLVERRAA